MSSGKHTSLGLQEGILKVSQTFCTLHLEYLTSVSQCLTVKSPFCK